MAAVSTSSRVRRGKASLSTETRSASLQFVTPAWQLRSLPPSNSTSRRRSPRRQRRTARYRICRGACEGREHGEGPGLGWAFKAGQATSAQRAQAAGSKSERAGLNEWLTMIPTECPVTHDAAPMLLTEVPAGGAQSLQRGKRSNSRQTEILRHCMVILRPPTLADTSRPTLPPASSRTTPFLFCSRTTPAPPTSAPPAPMVV
jgi:hypothetical protein